MDISCYITLCDAFVSLMKPLVEIVIHDLKMDRIHHVSGHLSKRKVGDHSSLGNEKFENNIDKIVYPKINFDGRLVKSISVPIEDKWLICINCDVSVFHQLKDLSDLFLAVEQKQPDSLFKNDWQEKLHITVHNYVQSKNWNFTDLTNNKKKEIINHLYNEGAFLEKNAADYIAQILTIGRATVFKYLKEWRNQ